MDGKVGIIFMRGNDLWIDSTPVRDAVDYGALKTHNQGHPSYWEQLQERHAVPMDEEYDEVPRGRVTYDTRKQVYFLFLDRCIRERPDIVSEIFMAMHLPPVPATEVGGDSTIFVRVAGRVPKTKTSTKRIGKRRHDDIPPRLISQEGPEPHVGYL